MSEYPSTMKLSVEPSVLVSQVVPESPIKVLDTNHDVTISVFNDFVKPSTAQEIAAIDSGTNTLLNTASRYKHDDDQYQAPKPQRYSYTSPNSGLREAKTEMKKSKTKLKASVSQKSGLIDSRKTGGKDIKYVKQMLAVPENMLRNQLKE